VGRRTPGWLLGVFPRASLGLAIAVIAAASMAQSVVVPAAFAGSEGQGGGLWAFTPFESHGQVLIDARHLTGQSGRDLLAITLRRNGGESRAAEPGRLWIELSLSNSSRLAADASSSFAANRGQDHTMAFAGYVDFPRSPAFAGTPVLWQAPYVVSLAMQKVLRYQGQTLCIETVTRLVAPNDARLPSPPDWSPDVTHAPRTGSAGFAGKGCIPGMPDPAATATSLSLGDTMVLSLAGSCGAGLALHLLGGTRLDLALDAYGAPGCFLLSDRLLITPAAIQSMPAGPAAIALFDLPLPALPRLAGARLYSQWMVMDPTANRLGLTFSNGVVLTLGAPVGSGTCWIESTELAASQGRVTSHVAPILRLDFK